MLRPPIVLALVVCLLALMAHAAPADAQSDAGTDFTGTHEAGGIIHFTLAPGGDRITTLDVDGIAGGGCSWDIIDLSNWGGAISVTEGHFEATNPDGDSVTGLIVAPGRAEGTRWVAAAPG